MPFFSFVETCRRLRRAIQSILFTLSVSISIQEKGQIYLIDPHRRLQVVYKMEYCMILHTFIS